MWNNSREIARTLRKNQTEAEKAFWELVRNRKFENIKFLRQYPIKFEYEGRSSFFVADFYCAKKKLIIEIDGGIHKTQKNYDKMRTKILEKMGYKIIRFTNEEVISKDKSFLQKLKSSLVANS